MGLYLPAGGIEGELQVMQEDGGFTVFSCLNGFRCLAQCRRIGGESRSTPDFRGAHRGGKAKQKKREEFPTT